MKFTDGSKTKVRKPNNMSFKQIKLEAQAFILKVIFVITVIGLTVIMHVL